MSNKAMSIGKILYGGVQVANGFVTACGGGLLGAYLRQHGMSMSALAYARYSVRTGIENMQNGIREISPRE